MLDSVLRDRLLSGAHCVPLLFKVESIVPNVVE